MKARHFVNQLEKKAIVQEIAEAELKTRGEIRVFISRKEPADVMAVAQQAFNHLRMDKAPEKNGVLLFVAPRVKKFAVIGDTAVHALCGDQFWTEVVEEMSACFKKEDFTGGILHGVRRAGKLLAEHFPRRAEDQTAPTDTVEED